MKRQSHLTQSLTAGTLLLIGTLAAAQIAPQTKTQSTHSSSSNLPRGMAVDHQGGNGVRRTAGNQNANVQPSSTPAPSTPAAATRQKKHIAGVKYQDRNEPGNTGTNPLFQSKGKANLKPASGTGVPQK